MRDRNLRSGDLHEDLGILLLKAIGLIAPVPRQEDVGTDAFVTLIRPDGSRRLIPDRSFLVQLKSSSVSSVQYSTDDAMAWIRSLDFPLFIGRVDMKRSRIELFTTLRLHQVLLEKEYRSIDLLLDPGEERIDDPDVRRASLGQPIHAWSIADLNEPDFLANSYAVLRPHIDTLRRNRALRGIQSQLGLRWETGQPPTDGAEMMLILPESDIADTLRDMAPHARRLMMEVGYRKRYADFPIMLALFDLMKRWGADPDPAGLARMMTGYMAEGPEISTEDAICLRAAFQPGGSLDLRGLPINDDTLVAIPEDVMELSIAETSVTDNGVANLLRLLCLERLDLTGTRVSDDGLMMLTGLPKLRWVSVKGTQVTSDGVERFTEAHARVTVLS